MANVDQFTRLCEKYILTGSVDFDAMVSIKDVNRTQPFRKLSKNEIKTMLETFRQSIFKILESQFTSFKLLESSNSNTDGGDGFVETMTEGVKETFILELKFGSSTDANIGMSTMWNVCPDLKPLFIGWDLKSRRERREKVMDGTYSEEDIVIWNAKEYKRVAKEINKGDIKINHQVLDSIINGSGSVGVYDYERLRFSIDTSGKAIFTSSKDSVSDNYKLTAKATDKRLTLFFEGEYNQVRAIFHCKNNVKLPNGERIAAKTLLGSTCFNVWASTSEEKPQVDQYYTEKITAESCVNKLIETINENNVLKDFTRNSLWVEPSIGSGSFITSTLNSLQVPVLGFDVNMDYLEHHLIEKIDVIEKDFLKTNPSDYIASNTKIVMIGNPPFGKRGKLALEFINHASKVWNTKLIAFILPIQFDKYLLQSKVDPELKLINRLGLETDVFESPDGDVYEHLRTAFYIWGKGEWVKNLSDLRVREKPPVNHPDFKAWQYNRTKEAEKFFDKEKYGWDFAVLRQGYGDYNIKYTDPDTMDRKKQYIFIKAINQDVLKRLYKIDFELLSHKNTTIPGFGKADLVESYVELLS